MKTVAIQVSAVHPGEHILEDGGNIAEVVHIARTTIGFVLDLHNADGTLTEGKEYGNEDTVLVLDY